MGLGEVVDQLIDQGAALRTELLWVIGPADALQRLASILDAQ